MKYMLLVRVTPDADPEPGDADPTAWVEDGARSGMWLEGHRLRETGDATTVRVRDGRTLVTDGPFAEFKEHIAGFDLVEAAGLGQAAAYAGAHPVAGFGAIEVREVWQDVPRAGDGAGHRGIRYLMLMASGPGTPVPPPGSGAGPREWTAPAERRGPALGSARLRPAGKDTAATVRVREGGTLLVRGPYAEAPEQVTGYELVVAADLDEAIGIAAEHPSARLGAVEIRPLWEQEEV